MKNLYSSLIAILALVLFASLADAGPFPTWDKQINTPDRFKVLDDFKGEAGQRDGTRLGSTREYRG